jgi:exosome complex component RRP43
MLSQLMQDILTESKCINETDLCIKEGKLVWVLYIDLICLNNDGNVQDACCLAMISALKSVRLYEMDYDLDENKILIKKPLNIIGLKLYSEPVCTTLFSLEDNILLSDPNKQEEDFMRAFIIICTIEKSRICLIRKYGGLPLTSEQVNLCIERASLNGNYVRDYFYKMVKIE